MESFRKQSVLSWGAVVVISQNKLLFYNIEEMILNTNADRNNYRKSKHSYIYVHINTTTQFKSEQLLSLKQSMVIHGLTLHGLLN